MKNKDHITVEHELTADEYENLRNSTVWTKLSRNQIEKLVENSTFLVRAKDHEKTVAMGRALFDFGYNAFLTDIVVLPEYQGRGIGKAVVEELISLVKSNAEKDRFLQFNLMAAPGKYPFYEKLGFYKRDEAQGYGMCMRLNKPQ